MAAVWTFFSLIYLFSLFSPSLWETALHRLKYCLKGPLCPKQPTNQPIYKHANFYRFEETSSYWSVRRRSVFLCFSLVNHRHTSVNHRHTSAITVYNRAVTNIEKLCGPCIAAIAGFYLIVLHSHKYFRISHQQFMLLSVPKRNIQMRISLA